MLPCEVFVTRLLPSIRRQIALSLLKRGRSQREIAKMIGITDSAISQYLTKKRGYAGGLFEKLAKRAMRFYNMGRNFEENVCEMCKGLRNSRDLCALHLKLEEVSKRECALCLKVCQ